MTLKSTSFNFFANFFSLGENMGAGTLRKSGKCINWLINITSFGKKDLLLEGCIYLFVALDGLIESLLIFTSSEVYSEPSQESPTDPFAKILNSFYPLTIFTNSSILDVWQSFEFTSDLPELILLFSDARISFLK